MVASSSGTHVVQRQSCSNTKFTSLNEASGDLAGKEFYAFAYDSVTDTILDCYNVGTGKLEIDFSKMNANLCSGARVAVLTSTKPDGVSCD